MMTYFSFVAFIVLWLITIAAILFVGSAIHRVATILADHWKIQE